jgi:transposase InsO family protein
MVDDCPDAGGGPVALLDLSAEALAIMQARLRKRADEVTPLPDARTVLELIGAWIEDYNENHPHSGLKMRSPREFIAAQTATA